MDVEGAVAPEPRRPGVPGDLGAHGLLPALHERFEAARGPEAAELAQRWADISDGKHGFSLLNDCKYGYDAKGNVLRLSLLRSPEWPDPHADEGHHEFTYSLLPHAGGWA